MWRDYIKSLVFYTVICNELISLKAGGILKENEIIEQLIEIVKEKLQKETSHDFWHVLRVYNNALDIAKHESNINLFTVQLAALLHDIADHKFGYSDEDRKNIIKEILVPFNISNQTIDEVIYIANHISFKGGKNTHVLKTLEAKIVQDADRLDAMGAIGIARTFAYGSHTNRPFYLPEKTNSEDIDTISHFYEKLLLLKDKMNTKTGKEKALERHKTMEFFLDNFYAEWNGKI